MTQDENAAVPCVRVGYFCDKFVDFLLSTRARFYRQARKPGSDSELLRAGARACWKVIRIMITADNDTMVAKSEIEECGFDLATLTPSV